MMTKQTPHVKEKKKKKKRRINKDVLQQRNRLGTVKVEEFIWVENHPYTVTHGRYVSVKKNN